MARVILLCGLPGAGKSTLARALASAAPDVVRLCPDEWMDALGIDRWDIDARGRVEQLQWTLAEDLLAAGVTVVVEWGVWSRAERDRLRSRARELGVPIELRYLDVPVDVLWQRLVARQAALPAYVRGITRAELDEWAATIEAPGEDEQALFDPPA